MSDYAKSLNDLARAGAQNGRIEALLEAVKIVQVIADSGGDNDTCLRILRAIGAHQERVIAGVTAERAIQKAGAM